MNRTWSVAVFMITVLLMVFSCSENESTNPAIHVPTVVTAPISLVRQTSAYCGGNITYDGGSPIIGRGVCWSTEQTPDLTDSKTNDGEGSGNYASGLTGLSGRTRYYVRAYASNSAGTGFGEIKTFITSDSMGTINDIDGNTYQTVKIGDRWWMAENLAVTHFRNGGSIAYVTDDSLWANWSVAGYCDYDNNVTNSYIYGRLYNWSAVSDAREIAPLGWHIPSDSEWQQLEMYLGMSQVDAEREGWRGSDEGGKLKELETIHWRSPNSGASNECGFCALPGGYRNIEGACEEIGTDARFWTTTEYNSFSAWYRELSNDNTGIMRFGDSKRFGCSIRCVKD